MSRRLRCWGPEPQQHARGCRPGRPRCRWRRPRPCECGAYHFPHRRGGGLCGSPEKVNEMLYGARCAPDESCVVAIGGDDAPFEENDGLEMMP